MSLSEVQVAQIRLTNARDRAKMLGDEARRQCMVYLASKKQWLDAVDLIAVRDREMNEKAAIEAAFSQREAEKARKGQKNTDEDQPA